MRSFYPKRPPPACSGAPALLQQRLGHRTIAVTEIYLAHLTPAEALRAKGLAG